MRIQLIANPVSGGDARPRIAQAAAWLRAHGAEVELCLTARRGDARAWAARTAERGTERIVVAGGDGTLNEVVNGVGDDAPPLAFLPLGTVNVFALETGIPFKLEAACRLALEGRPRRISLGRVNGERFLLMTSAGWDAAAVSRLRPAVKRRLGRLAYGVAAGEALLAQTPAPLSIILTDGSRHEGYGVLVSNARCYGGTYVITPQASLDSPRLEACLFRRGGRLAQLGYALRIALRLPLRAPAVDFFSIERLTIAGPGIPLQVDGDSCGELPVEISSEPAALSFILP